MSSYPVAFFYLAAIPSPSRSSSRASRVVERLASCHPVPSRASHRMKGKQARQERQAAPPHSYHLTIPRAPSHLMPNNQPPRPTTSTHETEERDAQARERRANTGDDERSERRSENARASQDDDKHETTNETHNETTTTRKKQTNRGAKVGGREEQTATFSHLSPDPLSPILSRPSASIIPPPPGVG